MIRLKKTDSNFCSQGHMSMIGEITDVQMFSRVLSKTDLLDITGNSIIVCVCLRAFENMSIEKSDL